MAQRSVYSIGIFLLLSVAVHGALLATNWPSQSVSLVNTHSPLSLTLTPLRKAKPETRQAKNPVSEIQPELAIRMPKKPVLQNTRLLARKQAAQHKVFQPLNKPVSSPAARKKVTVRINQLPGNTNTPATKEINNKPSISLAQVQHRISQKLNTRIAFFHYYPRLAIRNQWQGKVNLGLRVEANGQLSNIHVINSSGYSILDNAAMKSVHRVSAIPEAKPWLQGRHVELVLPVIYRLVDG